MSTRANATNSRTKKWPENIEDWPANQSSAAHDRDDAAMYTATIEKLSRRALDSVAAGKTTREELLYILAKINSNAGDVLRLLERNGAPTRPYP